MWLKIVLCVPIFITGVLSQCNDKIHVVGVSNVIAYGVYVKTSSTCDNKDVFRHSDNNTYLYHINGDADGYWMIRKDFTCPDNKTDDGLVRIKSADVNPGNAEGVWQEKTGAGWTDEPAIVVSCYELPACRYQLTGADNESLNGYYDVLNDGQDECSDRDVYKHEQTDNYLYFVRSATNGSYYWVVSDKKCDGSVVDDVAYLQNDDYSVSVDLIENTWQERLSKGNYLDNANITVQCVSGTDDSGLSAGAIAGITVGCLAAAGGLAGGIGYYFLKRK